MGSPDYSRRLIESKQGLPVHTLLTPPIGVFSLTGRQAPTNHMDARATRAKPRTNTSPFLE